MSSLPEKKHSLTVANNNNNNNNNKKSFFLRKDSIKKIKCTAMYPFQVAGLKLSNNVLIELIEKNIMKARICIQRALLNFYIVVLKLLSTILTLCYNIQIRYEEFISKKNIKQIETMKHVEIINRKMRFQRQQHVEIIDDDDDATDLTKAIENNKKNVDNCKGIKSSPQIKIKETYQSRLLAKLERIEKHKTRLNGKSLRLQLSSSTDIEQEDEEFEERKKNFKNKIQNDLNKNTLFEMNSIKFVDSIAKEYQQQQDKEKTKLQKYCLILCVHAGLFVMYLQVLVLCLVLNSVKIPTGLLFLIATGTIIGYILIKVSFFHKFSGHLKNSANNNKQCSIDDNNSNIGSNLIRQPRSTKRRAPMLDIDSKTLSKIKLL